MKKRFSTFRKPLAQQVGLFFLLVCILSACSMGGASNTSAGSGMTATTSRTSVQATPSSTIKSGVQACPSAVSSPGHWDAIIPTQANVSKVESVTCANLIGVPKLQALITVRADGTGGVLDVYVYNNITDPAPAQIFKLQSLYKGDAKISGYNTLLTAEVDQVSHVNVGKSDAGLTVDLFREFQWSDGAGTLVPVAFPGIYPDLTRYQAEADQQQVNQGHQPWKLSATQVASTFAMDMLKWPASQTSLLSGGGTRDENAVVVLKYPSAGGGTVKVSMSRLEGNTNGGIWSITNVESNGMTITSPQNKDRLTSPVQVVGKGNAFEGVIGAVVVLDHLYTEIGHVSARGAAGMGNTTFSTSVNYTSTFKTGVQEGVLVLYAYSNANDSIAGVIMLKQLLD